jgi:hypothetical protein
MTSFRVGQKLQVATKMKTSFHVAGVCRAFALISAICSSAHAQSVADSMARGLDSADMAVRYNAVASLGTLAPAAIPPNVRSRLIALLENEGVVLKSLVEPTVDTTADTGEMFPGYLSALAMEVAQFKDVRSLRGLVLVGLEISRGIQDFVVANAAASLPFLAEAFAAPRAEYSVMETWGMMLAPSRASLSAAQRQKVQASLLGAASRVPLGFVWAVSLGNLVDLEPVVHAIAASNDDPIIVSRATQVDADLVSTLATRSTTAALTGAQNWLTAFCVGATGSRIDACQSLKNEEANAVKLLADGNRTAAKSVLSSLVSRAQSAQASGDLTAFEASIVIVSAQRVLATL